MRKFIAEGLTAVETLLDHPDTGKFCHGDTPSMADFCLVPQVYNARRWGTEVNHLSRINTIVEHCGALEAFAAAQPDRVKRNA